MGEMMFVFFFKTAFKSIQKQKQKFFTIVIASAIGSAVIASMLGSYLDIEGKMALELTGFGANIEVAPKDDFSSIEVGGVSFGGGGGYLAQQDLLNLKTENTFWRNNIVNVSPFLYVGGVAENAQVVFAGTWFSENVVVENQIYTFGVTKMFSWGISGAYPKENNEVLLGIKIAEELAISVGDEINAVISGKDAKFKVSGIAQIGGVEDYLIFMNLDALQEMTATGENVSKAYVSALVKPDDDLALRVELYGPSSLNSADFQRWYCSPYTSAIIYNIEEVAPYADASRITKFSELQGGILKDTSAVFGSLAAVGFLVSIVSISSATKMYIESRKKEIGVLKAIGSTDGRIINQLLFEMLVSSIIASIVGYTLSLGLASYIGNVVFSSAFQMSFGLFWIVFGVSILLSFLTVFLLRNEIKKLDPIKLMR